MLFLLHRLQVLFGHLPRFPGLFHLPVQTKPVPEIERKLYPDYDNGSYQREYIELKEEVRV